MEGANSREIPGAYGCCWLYDRGCCAVLLERSTCGPFRNKGMALWRKEINEMMAINRKWEGGDDSEERFPVDDPISGKCCSWSAYFGEGLRSAFQLGRSGPSLRPGEQLHPRHEGKKDRFIESSSPPEKANVVEFPLHHNPMGKKPTYKSVTLEDVKELITDLAIKLDFVMDVELRYQDEKLESLETGLELV
ncbi:unnamed protein product [Allacma fusca]|uniref:Uncharacterized protein n=1 Tax=Allacma fusca TaxID=39272 RepID=A0A8J2LI09_9HEXA|nr:unnamed protein product [Allacma fusca]